MKWLLSLFFPLRCAGCKSKGVFMCSTCVSNLARANHTHVITAFDYNDPLVHKSIIRMKEFPDTVTAKLFADVLADHIQEFLFDQCQYGKKYDQLVFVPIPPRRARIREFGFNQTELIAQSLCELFPDSRTEQTLIRIKHTKKQALLKNKSERLENISGAFALNPRTKISPTALYIIVDDVITTGATMTEAVAVIGKSGGGCAPAGFAWQNDYANPKIRNTIGANGSAVVP